MTDHRHPTAKPEDIECDTCDGSGKIVHEARTTGANQHSACQEGCEDCDGTGRVLVIEEPPVEGPLTDEEQALIDKGWVRITAKPEGEGAPVDAAVAIRALINEPLTGPTHGAWDRGRTSGLKEALSIVLSASPPVPAVAGEWDSLIDYLENQTAKTDEGRAIIAEWIAQAKALNAPTPSADQSGRVRDRLLKATEAASRLSTTTEEDAAVIDELVAASAEARQHLHHTADQSGVIGALEAVLSEKLERRTLALDEANARIGALVEALEEIERASYANSEEEGIARQALAAHAASIGGKS